MTSSSFSPAVAPSVFNKVIKNDESFNRFICKISNTFINTAVMAPNNLLYEKDLIEMWLDAKEKEIKEAIENGHAGHEKIDVPRWRKLMFFLEGLI